MEQRHTNPPPPPSTVPPNNHSHVHTITHRCKLGGEKNDSYVITHLKNTLVCSDKWEDNLSIKSLIMGEEHIIRVVIISFSLPQKV